MYILNTKCETICLLLTLKFVYVMEIVITQVINNMKKNVEKKKLKEFHQLLFFLRIIDKRRYKIRLDFVYIAAWNFNVYGPRVWAYTQGDLHVNKLFILFDVYILSS